MTRGARRIMLLAVSLLAVSGSAFAASPQRCGPPIATPAQTVTACLHGPGVVHIKVRPRGVHGDRQTLVMDPDGKPLAVPHARVTHEEDSWNLVTRRLRVRLDRGDRQLDIDNAQGARLLRLDLDTLAVRHVTLAHDHDDSLYGIGSYRIHQSVAPGLLRSGKQIAKAGKQGHAGAPFVWSTAGYGILVDSDGASFHLSSGQLRIDQLSQPVLDLYVMVGKPRQLFAELDNLTGHPPMFPKWSMGFLNTQWGIDQKELVDIIQTYRRKHIPIDGFILDFDWKAWGKDDYGEFRWNPEKFPDGPDGKLAKHMRRLGIHLAGIMKPRIHVNTVEGRYATRHHLWFPDETASKDYFSHKPVKDVDFDKARTRAWFGRAAMKYGFDDGIVGWWNDEADETDSNTQFLNMERALYTAQRARTDTRVWSLNRDFWLGAQRYAYGLWSGDIDTGFETMAKQRTRMLSAIDVGETWWGMDGGGFNGHPSDQNYARWMEFAAFVPIFRVHGTHGEKRQPWHYGKVAGAAAVKAIRLRYRLLPYIYSYAHHATVAGVGLVRPLTFGWPEDPRVRNDVDAWMFGRWLLVSPVVKKDQRRKHIYLPAGTWTDWSSGKVYHGGRTITVPVDHKTWADIPLFIRQGAIIATQPVLPHTGERPVTTISLDVFPSSATTHFDYYEDDGDTYAYQHGEFFEQRLSVRQRQGQVTFTAAAPAGSYRPAVRFYLLGIHAASTGRVTVDGRDLPRAKSLDALKHATGEGWASGHDRYGKTTWVRLRAGAARKVNVAAPSP